MHAVQPHDSLSSPFIINILQLDHGKDLPLPTYGTSLSAGMDLYAAIQEDVTLQPGKRALIPSGIAIALSPGYEAQIRSRSGLALKNGIMVLNSPGTIDADYRGEIIGIMMNLGEEPFTISRGMRFAQLIIAQYVSAQWQQVPQLDQTERGTNRFGSTGLV